MATYRIVVDPTPLYQFQDTAKAELLPRLHPPAHVTLIESGLMAKVKDGNGRIGFVEWRKIMLVDEIPQPPQPSGQYCVTLHGFELPQHDYKNDVDYYFPSNPGVMARPCAYRMKEFRPTEMTKRLQELHFSILKSYAPPSMLVNDEGKPDPSDMKAAFASIWKPGREYNDNGAGIGNNFINKPNADGPGFSMNPIVGDGAVLKIVGSVTTQGYILKNGNKQTFGLGEPCYPVEMMNGKAIDYTSTPALHPWKWHRATIARREGYIWPYFQLEGNDVWMPNLCRDNNVNWIPCNVVRVLADGEAFPSPYVPQR